MPPWNDGLFWLQVGRRQEANTDALPPSHLVPNADRHSQTHYVMPNVLGDLSLAFEKRRREANTT